MSGKKKENRPRGGSIRVTWAQCPNRECPSRQWDVWHVDYDEDRFKCGTCERKLLRPIFICSIIEPGKCPICRQHRERKRGT